MIWFYTSLSCPELNLIKDKIPVLGLDIVERLVEHEVTTTTRIIGVEPVGSVNGLPV